MIADDSRNEFTPAQVELINFIKGESHAGAIKRAAELALCSDAELDPDERFELMQLFTLAKKVKKAAKMQEVTHE